MVEAANFGVSGDGVTDDTAALEHVLRRDRQQHRRPARPRADAARDPPVRPEPRRGRATQPAARCARLGHHGLARRCVRAELTGRGEIS